MCKSAHACDRDETALAGKSRPNGIGNGRGGSQESAKAVVVDGNDGDGRMPLFLRHALVGGDEGREAAPLRLGQEFVVRERAPVVVNSRLDRDTAKLLLEGLA